ncbi:MAG: (Fe-S)-binding protein [Betaproteobacteria bacterium]|nr:(Fe-S)-binding protein [Betaproteobacteria bacterium]
MPLPIAPILGIFADNLRKRDSVLPLSKKTAMGWANGLNLPRGGKTVIYTGHVYQMIPAIDAMASQMALLENSFLTRFFGIGRLMNKFVSLSFFMGLTASSEKMRHSNQVLRDIVGLLRDAGVEFGYLYEEELYAGALVYDDGMDETFGHHARRVAERLKKLGVRRLLTVDPHTTKMFRQAYPHFVKDFDIEVQSYLEVLAQAHPKAMKPVNGEVVVHDSCVYARYENVCDQPRELLRAAGLSVREPELSGKSTHCCGGPLESLFPAEAHRISGIRVDQLEAKGKNVVTMCPFCWVNLNKAAGDRLVINDIATTLASCRRQASSCS